MPKRNMLRQRADATAHLTQLPAALCLPHQAQGGSGLVLTTPWVVLSTEPATHCRAKSTLLLLFFSCSVVSDSLRPHGQQYSRHSCPSLSPGVCSSSCPLIESVMPSNHLSLCHPVLLQPSIFPSIRVFSNESALHIRWPRYWSFSLS